MLARYTHNQGRPDDSCPDDSCPGERIRLAALAYLASLSYTGLKIWTR